MIDGREYWFAVSSPAARSARTAVHLLGNYDEYVVGYTDRDAIFDAVHAEHLDARHNPLFNHAIVSRGAIIGTWKRTVTGDELKIEAKLFHEPGRQEERALNSAANRLSRFLGLKAAQLQL